MATQPRVIHEFEVSRGTIRSTLNDFGGKTYFDLRLWVEPRDQPGAALIPTKRDAAMTRSGVQGARASVRLLGRRR
jgi:hypothetical protein